MKSLIIFATIALALTVLPGIGLSQMNQSRTSDDSLLAHSASIHTVSGHTSDSAGHTGTIINPVSNQSSREATAAAMTKVVDQIIKENASGSSQRLHDGRKIDITTMIDTGQSVVEWHSVNLKATYDLRPIGGILDIRVGIAPVFGGIGAAIRTADFREFDESIDKFDDDFIARTISSLAEELAEEYSKKQ